MDALQGAIDVDTNIFFSINRMHNMYFDYFMSAYSGKWVWIPMYAAIYGAQNETYMSRSAKKWVKGLCFNELGVGG